jgi:hypothetical protein
VTRSFEIQLEKKVRHSSKIVNFEKFTSELLELSACVARFEGVDRFGMSTSGTCLIYENKYALTNAHVVHNIINFEKCAIYLASTTTDLSREDIKLRLESQPILGVSPIGQLSDYSESFICKKKRDLVLLELHRDSLELVKGKSCYRGSFEIELQGAEDILILSRRIKNNLEIGSGRVIEYGSDLLVAEHDALTSPGSSGSPCVSFDVKIVGLHQGASDNNVFITALSILEFLSMVPCLEFDGPFVEHLERKRTDIGTAVLPTNAGHAISPDSEKTTKKADKSRREINFSNSVINFFSSNNTTTQKINDED